jgi:chemotaxis protein CheD
MTATTTITPTTTQEKGTLLVAMGDIVVSAAPEAVITCFGIGSCVAVCAYDGSAKVGGVAHVVLPTSKGAPVANPATFADTAVPCLLDKIEKLGGVRSRLIVKIAGGAKLSIAPGIKNIFNIGEQNAAQIIAALEKENVTLAAADIGGTLGRTVRMHLGTGKVTIKTVNGTVSEL